MIQSETQARAWLLENGIDQAALSCLEHFVAMLAMENERQNLVAASSLPSVWQRHIVDSAQLHRYLPSEIARTWLDLGTGAGFPGVIIAIIQPTLQVVFVESRRKRIEWLEYVKAQLGLTNVTVVGRRLETVPSASFDVISARAFAPMSELLRLAHRFSTNATTWLLPKGRSAVHEIAALDGWEHTFHVEPSITDPTAGIVVGTLLAGKAIT